MRIRFRIQLITLMRIWSGFLFDADADPGYLDPDADPDRQHCVNH
jgi:hypothetical protein